MLLRGAEVWCSNSFTSPRSCDDDDPKLSTSLNVLSQLFPPFVLISIFFFFLIPQVRRCRKCFGAVDRQRAIQGSSCVLCILYWRLWCSGGVGSFSFVVVQRNGCGRVPSDNNPDLFGLGLLFCFFPSVQFFAPIPPEWLPSLMFFHVPQ